MKKWRANGMNTILKIEKKKKMYPTASAIATPKGLESLVTKIPELSS